MKSCTGYACVASFIANLAHLVEQHPRNVQVLGSTPRVGFLFWKLIGSGGSRGLQNRWLLKLAMAGSIPASSVFLGVG